MIRSSRGRWKIMFGLLALPWITACCANGDCAAEVEEEPEVKKIYVDKYERIPCKNCPKPKYVYHKAPPLPEKVIRVHRIYTPCPPQRVINVQLPPEKQKVKYEYIDEGTCETEKKPCFNPCRKPCS